MDRAAYFFAGAAVFAATELPAGAAEGLSYF
jgi:hypothetical protein